MRVVIRPDIKEPQFTVVNTSSQAKEAPTFTVVRTNLEQFPRGKNSTKTRSPIKVIDFPDMEPYFYTRISAVGSFYQPGKRLFIKALTAALQIQLLFVMNLRRLLDHPKRSDRLITVLVILLAGNLFFFLKLFGRQSVDQLVETNRSYYFLLPTLAALLISLFMLYAEDHLFKPTESRTPFYVQLLLRWGINSFIIVLVAIGVDSGISLLNGARMGAALSHSLYFLTGELFISFYLFFILSSFFLHFIKQLGNWFGYGVLLNYFLGKYNQPQEEEKAFLFIDLKNSTGIAEQLGHQKYSRFLNKCFTDLSDVAEKYRGEVYQYVGDEAVLSWNVQDARRKLAPIRLFFEYQQLLYKQKEVYQEKFGVQPRFKASLNSGRVIQTQVGGRQKEVAYHGDVLNTAARMLELCNRFNRSFLISEDIAVWELLKDTYHLEFLSEIVLRGKERRTRVYSITEREESV